MSSTLLRSIQTRRSVGAYTQKEVPQAKVITVLDAARWAPSAHNAQPWRFIVVTDHDVKRRLAEAMADEWAEDLARDGVRSDVRRNLVESSVERFTKAPVLIIASITMEDMDKYPDETRRESEYSMATQSLAAAIQNMLLVAKSQELGSCWFCAPLFCQDVVRKVLGIPHHVEPQALVTLGYPSEQPDAPRRKPLREVVFKNRWGGSF